MISQTNETLLLTIITVVYNSNESIEKTLLSVFEQEQKNFEYIVIDGGSTDGTAEIIKMHEYKLAYWISEPDNGIYDAMNKAIAKASGKYIYFINCGDTLLNIPADVLQKSNADMLCFSIETNAGIRKPKLGFTFFLTNTLPHQGIFYKRSSDVFFDSSYKVFADYALNLDFYRKGKVIKTYNEIIIANHSLDGVSNSKKKFKEFFQVVKRKSGIHYLALSYLYFKWLGLKNRLK